MTLALTGHAVASGIAIGQTHLAERNELEIGEYRIEPEDVAKEITRYHQAVDAARKQLDDTAQRISRNVGIPAGEIIQTHVQMLKDEQEDMIHAHPDLSAEECRVKTVGERQLHRIISPLFRKHDTHAE